MRINVKLISLVKQITAKRNVFQIVTRIQHKASVYLIVSNNQIKINVNVNIILDWQSACAQMALLETGTEDAYL